MSNISIKDLKQIIKDHYKHNIELATKGFLPNTLRVLGESGIGKTSIVKEASEELCAELHDEGIRWKKINLANISDVAELIGYPKTKTLIKKDGEEMWVWDESLSIYPEWTKTNRTVTSYAHPEWIEYLSSGGILCLDDYNRSSSRVLQAIMEILDRREYISWKLPDNVLIVLTGNPSNGDYLVTSEDAAQTSRYITYEVEFDFKSWSEWASKNNIKFEYIDFIKINEEELFKKSDINIRQWTKIFSLASITQLNDTFFNSLIKGCVGNEKALLFMDYLSDIGKIEITGEEIVNGEYKAISKKLNGLIFKKDYYRHSISSVIASRIINYINSNPIENICKKASEKLIKLTSDKIFNIDTMIFLTQEISDTPLYNMLLSNDVFLDLINESDVETK